MQDIPFFFTLQNCSHPFSYMIFKVIRREVSALTACCKLICSVMCFTLLLLIVFIGSKWQKISMCALSAFCFLAEDTVAEIYQVWMFFIIFLKRDSHISLNSLTVNVPPCLPAYASCCFQPSTFPFMTLR